MKGPGCGLRAAGELSRRAWLPFCWPFAAGWRGCWAVVALTAPTQTSPRTGRISRFPKPEARSPIFLAAMLLICAVSAPAQIQTIADTIFTADGSLASGRAEISWPAFQSGAGPIIGAGSKRVDFTNGAFSTVLEATTSATPANVSYRVRFAILDRDWWVERWVVPTGGPHTIAAVRVVTVPTPALAILLSQIAPSGASSGQVPVFNGSSWLPGTVGAGSGLDCSSPATLTIDAAGAVTVSATACYLVDTFAMAASDDLETVNCSTGQRFVFSPVSGARVITVKASAGIPGQADFVLNHTADNIGFVCQTTNIAVMFWRANGG